MAYEKQTWACDDIITATKLNHMEQGIEDAQSGGTVEPLRVNLTRNISEASCENHIFTDTDKTYMEIGTALVGGRNVVFIEPNGNVYMVIAINNNFQQVGIITRDGWCWFHAIGDGTMEYPNCVV